MSGALLCAAVWAGCDANCEAPGGPCALAGQPEVDLSGPEPVFRIVGGEADAEQPNELDVFGPGCEGGGGAWQVDRMKDVADVTYGRLPDGARELTPPMPLEDGEVYSVYFAYWDRNPFTSTGLGWDPAFFVAGDPESYTLEDPCL